MDVLLVVVLALGIMAAAAFLAWLIGDNRGFERGYRCGRDDARKEAGR